MPSENDLCDNCRLPRNKHLLVNYADGPNIGAPGLVCPAATFIATSRCFLGDKLYDDYIEHKAECKECQEHENAIKARG